MPELHFVSCPVESDSFVLLPAIVITQGRHEETDELKPAWLVQVQWMMWGFGVCIAF